MPYSSIISLAERYDQQLAQLEGPTIAHLNHSIDQAYRELTDDIINGWKAIAANKSLIPQQQRILLADQLGDLLQVVRPERRAEYEKLMQDAIAAGDRLGAEFTDRVNAGLQPGAKVGDMLKATTGVPIEALTNQAQDGLRRLYRHGEDAASKISAIVEQGLIQNWGPRKVAATIETTAGLVKSHAETITRTEINSAFNGAAQARAIVGDYWIQWVALSDDRVCPSCAYRQMKVYRANEIHIPGHPRCRCVAVALKKEWLADIGVIDDADLAFMVQYREDTLAELKATGQKPRKAAPFDVGEPPVAVWTPKLERPEF
jgi:SPP1 gp7 family putative phage head morphogenesis protein